MKKRTAHAIRAANRDTDFVADRQNACAQPGCSSRVEYVHTWQNAGECHTGFAGSLLCRRHAKTAQLKYAANGGPKNPT